MPPAWTGLALAAGAMAVLCTGQAAAETPEQPPPEPQPQPRSNVPEGFEDIDGSIETIFDVYFQGERIAATPGRLSDGVFTFQEPDALVRLLPGVDAFKVSTWLSAALPSNESLRCPPGETIDCGVLLVGASGVIVDPDRFRVDIFLSRDLLSDTRDVVRMSAPVSGLSLIQGIGASFSANNSGSDLVRAGIELNTLASVGRTSFASRIYGDDDRGLRVDEAYFQHYQSETRFSAGLFNSEGTLAASAMRVAGAKVSSFFGDYVGQADFSASAIEVVLPRPARAEIYRDGVLMSSAQYPGGLQYLDTSRLPEGSYPIRVVVRDASGVILDEVRTFTRAADLPPVGKTVYSVSAGVRMSDSFSAFTDLEESEAFFPKSTGETVLSASASHRIASNVAAGLSLTSVGGDLYPEVSLQAYHGAGRGFVSFATGPDGQYGAVAGGSLQFGPVNTSLDMRVVNAPPLPADPVERFTKYRPFLRDERSINATAQSAFLDGQLSLRAAFGEFSDTEDRYFVGVSYSQPAGIDWLGSGIVRFEASASDADTRVGLRFTLTERVDAQSMRSATLGGEYVRARSGVRDSGSSGFFPVAQLGYTRDFEIDDTQLSASALAGVSDGEVSAQAALRAQSGMGEVDTSIGVVKPNSDDNADLYLTGNLRTGFVYGNGSFHFGSAGYGDAAVLVEIDEDESRGAHDGRFQVVVDGLPQDHLRVGQRTVISLPAFTQPRISLSPEAAPPFDIDLSAREAPLYPGNVVFMSWSAVRVVTAYGRLLDGAGQPREGVFVGAGNDIAVTGEGGYFSVTAPVGARLAVRDRDGASCGELTTLPEPKSDARRAVVNLGALVCVDVQAGPAVPDAAPEAAPQTLAPEQTGALARLIANALLKRRNDEAALAVAAGPAIDRIERQGR